MERDLRTEHNRDTSLGDARLHPANVLEQAKRYAAGAYNGVGNSEGLRVPFLYASSGEIIWHLDVRPAKRVSRQLKGFHSPEALQWLFNQDSTPAIDWLIQTPPEGIERLRTYQGSCILAVEKEIIAGRRDLNGRHGHRNRKNLCHSRPNLPPA
jgi:type I restriction enzyme, R subunit